MTVPEPSTIEQVATQLRDLAHRCDKSTGIHPVMANRVLHNAVTDLHTCATALLKANKCGLGPDGDINLALALANVHAAHRQGDHDTAIDFLRGAEGYIRAEQKERQR